MAGGFVDIYRKIYGWWSGAEPVVQDPGIPGVEFRVENISPRYVVPGEKPRYKIENISPRYKIEEA